MPERLGQTAIHVATRPPHLRLEPDPVVRKPAAGHAIHAALADDARYGLVAYLASASPRSSPPMCWWGRAPKRW